ncbi:hypothetical protein H0H93_007750 [Arthromyces matolae]|nr:hypothetical protein H0H93_007750 [Arthromyces matolae]
MANEPVIIEDIEESEITGENAEVYVFQWLSSTERKISEATPQHLKEVQGKLESTFVKIITAPEPYPNPGRALRNVTGRSLVALYTRGETRTLFDTLQAFMRIVGDFKSASDKDVNKIAAYSCIGDIMGAFGSQLMSFMAEIHLVSLKTVKSSQSSLLRFHALVALRKSLTTAKRAVTDSALKDILKQMRYCLTDKALSVQREAANVLTTIYSGADGTHPTGNDAETIVNLCVKSLETADQATRHCLAQLVGHMLASTQIERAVPVPEPAHKVKKDKDEDDADAGLSSAVSVAAEVKKPTFTPNEMLSHLSNHFNKPNVSRKTRTGIFDFYAALLTRLGPTFVEANFALIVSHLMTEIVSNPRNATTRYETLHIRSLVGLLLRDLIGVRMLSEQGQISAIQELANAYLKRWPAMMPGQVAPSSKVLVIVLREVAGLVQQLGNAPPPVQDALAEPLVTLLAHPSHTTRINAAWTLRCFCYSTPLRLPKIILTVTDMLQRDITSITSPAAPSDINLRSLGHAYGLAALISIIPERPLYVSYDVSAKVLDMAISLLKRASEHDLKIAAVEVEVAWTSIASLMALGPNFVRPHLPQLLVLWRNALPKPTSKDGGVGRSIAEWMFLLNVRESALGAILYFLHHNASTLVTLDVGRRIASLLSNALSFANNFISQNIEEPVDIQHPQEQTKGLNLRSSEALLRRQQLLDSVRSPKLERNSGRKAAVHINATTGLLLALRNATSSHFRQARETFGSSQITSLLSPFLQEALVDGDVALRTASSESIGRLASLSGTTFLTAQIKDLVDRVVTNRDPYGRAGCALAFGAIYSHVGGLAAGPLLKTTVNVLMSLSNDPHPVAHFWALSALAQVINAASLAYAPFVSSTLGMLLKIYLMESHEREGGTLLNANLGGEYPAYPVVCQIIDAVISVLGPDIQESPRTRALILNLVREFSVEDADSICVEAIKCIQHFLMFAPDHVNIPDLVSQFRSHLSSSRRPLKLASINALYQLVQKDAFEMSKLGGDRLVEDLFGMLDDDSSVQGVRNVISSWLEQTVVHNPSAWIDLCQRIMSRTTASQQVVDAAGRQGGRDDEGESLSLGMAQDGGAGSYATSRWRTQLFALQCLHHICTIVSRSGRREQLDAAYAQTLGLPTKGLLVTRVPDLIKMAFTASAAYVTEIRLEGLIVLRDVIEQKYLENVLKPHRITLASLWIAALRDYASIRIDSEFLNDTSTVALDSSYSSLGKEVLLPYYAKSWPVILQAVATSMDNNDPYILAAMDGQESIHAVQQAKPAKREEPTAFFYTIFGLVYEALVTSSVESTSTPLARQTLVVSTLQALKCLVRPEYSGNALKEPTIFDEFVSLCYRIAMTEPARVQIHLLEVLSSFASYQENVSGSGDELSLTSPKAHCLRICSYILQHSISASRGHAIPGETSDRVKMIIAAFSAMQAIALSLHSLQQREDIRAVSILLYAGK